MRHFMENMSQFILRQGIRLQHENSNGPTNEAIFGFDNVLLGHLPLQQQTYGLNISLHSTVTLYCSFLRFCGELSIES